MWCLSSVRAARSDPTVDDAPVCGRTVSCALSPPFHTLRTSPWPSSKPREWACVTVSPIISLACFPLCGSQFQGTASILVLAQACLWSLRGHHRGRPVAFPFSWKGSYRACFPFLFLLHLLDYKLYCEKKKSVNWKVLGDISLTGLGSVGHALHTLTVWLLLT